MIFLKRWGTKSYGRVVPRMRGELLIRCARVLIRMESFSDSTTTKKILGDLQDIIVTNKNFGPLERVEATYTLAMFEYRNSNENKALDMLKSVFEDARRLSSPRLCRRLGRFLAYLMMRRRVGHDDDDVISYLLFWSLGSASRQRALAELRRREAVSENEISCSDRLSELFAHSWRDCNSLNEAATSFRNLVNDLPKDWSVVGVCTPPREFTYFEEDSNLMLTRIESNRSFVCFGQGKICDVRNVLLEFQDILSCAEKTTKGITPFSGKDWTKSERKRWWDERYDQDNRMKNMLRSMQQDLLGSLGVKRLFGCGTKVQNDDDFDALCARFEKLKVVSLKSQLKERDLSRAGRKNDLVKRLASAVSSNSSPSPSSTSLICIFDEILQRLPWESMPHIRDNTLPVSRCPAAAFVFASCIRNRSDENNVVITATFRNARTLVNPSGDLKRTQKKMKPVFERLGHECNWKSISTPGEKPPEGSVREALESPDCELFVYCGHNAGEEFLSSKHALRLRSTPNVMMLVGCSSGRLRDEGMFEPHGTILQYACAGVPCIVANLWDVTDADIDRFLIRLLEELSQQGCGRDKNVNVSLLRAVSVARSACKLQYAVGAAPVCYGVPVLIC